MSKLLSTSDYLKLPELFYQYVSPEAAFEPKYNIFNENLAKELNLDTDYLLSNEGLAILSGKETTHLTPIAQAYMGRSEEHTSELQSRGHLVCRLLLEKKNKHNMNRSQT